MNSFYARITIPDEEAALHFMLLDQYCKLNRAEDRSMGRAVFCQVGNNSAVKAVMEYYGNKEVKS